MKLTVPYFCGIYVGDRITVSGRHYVVIGYGADVGTLFCRRTLWQWVKDVWRGLWS